MCGTARDKYCIQEWRTQEKQEKSRKRKAAELKLARRASCSHLHDGRHYDLISDANSSENEDGSSSSLNTVCPIERDWARQCMHVNVPAKMDWNAVFSNPRYFYSSTRELDVLVIEEEVEKGLQWLNQGARDSVVAIDLEWRPDSRHTNNNVACIQLATQKRCLIIRCCCWKVNGLMPQVLIDFFRNPENMFVSFSWDRGDEKKMCSTFGIGKRLFWNFVDMKQIAMRLGYPDTCGLSMLSRFVLGASLPKSKFVSRSDWQRHVLSSGQVRYAALDAFVTGEIFRTFRAWRALPKRCVTCDSEQGSIVRQEVRLH